MSIRAILVLFGVIEMVMPKRVVDYIMKLSTKGTPEYEFKSWVYLLARLEGLVIVVLALRYGRESTNTDES
ncbi:hypothetical protein [Haloplanus salilacus]|uniref:hypothetical protein n=1 Tax=Haloplanus salilacus TaxID=2949994 RepID=UPI0030D0DCD5